MSTIQDVARHAGVSISTVSNVLNGRADRMRHETLTRVQTAIRALEFTPNRAARQLKTGQTSMLGLLVPSIANPMYGFIAREIETSAQERYGYRVVLGNTYRNKEKETGFFDDLLAQGVRGVIVISSLVDEQHFESAVERGLVMVSYDRRATPDASSGIDHVSVDNFEAARMATLHLIGRGHRRLAFATASGLTMSRSEKIRGFFAAAHDAGLGASASVVDRRTLSEYGDSEMADVGRALAGDIARMPQRPTGIVAVNDMLAFGLMAGFRDAGLEVPRDVSVIGIDGLFLSSLVTPALSTVQLPVARMARTMVDRVIGRLDDPAIPTGEFLFQPEMVERASVGPADPTSPGRAAPESPKPGIT
ncbi:MAG: LacI family DNA-binding transcriptional regulator [Lautropia sp.]|nr:LacI family DNA-binding transcriptional regulator [Lautropia sp.]